MNIGWSWRVGFTKVRCAVLQLQIGSTRLSLLTPWDEFATFQVLDLGTQIGVKLVAGKLATPWDFGKWRLAVGWTLNSANFTSFNYSSKNLESLRCHCCTRLAIVGVVKWGSQNAELRTKWRALWSGATAVPGSFHIAKLEGVLAQIQWTFDSQSARHDALYNIEFSKRSFYWNLLILAEN